MNHIYLCHLLTILLLPRNPTRDCLLPFSYSNTESQESANSIKPQHVNVQAEGANHSSESREKYTPVSNNKSNKNKNKNKKKGPAAAVADSNVDAPLWSQIDIRVGTIVKAWPHPDAEKLFCEEIDVGEPQARTIASGLREWYSAEQMQGQRVLVVCNLKVGHGVMAGASNLEEPCCVDSAASVQARSFSLCCAVPVAVTTAPTIAWRLRHCT
jgi:tRNA-binding EMAP/Myf-like protein